MPTEPKRVHTMKRTAGIFAALGVATILVWLFLSYRSGEGTPIDSANTTVGQAGGSENTSSAPQAQPPTTSPAMTTPPVQSPPPPSATDVGAELVWGQDPSRPAGNWTKPELYEPMTDPAYGSEVRRMTDAAGTRFDRNTYSRRQAENADGMMFFTYHGEAGYRVYERSTGDLVRILDIDPDASPQWHPTDPDVVRFNSGDNSYVGDLKYHEMNVLSGHIREIADLRARIQARYPSALYLDDRAEGSPSLDGSRIAWLVYNELEDAIAIVHYDLDANQILGLIDVPTDGGPVDWVSSSISGDYVVVGQWERTDVYDANMTNQRPLNDKAGHSDIALAADGSERYVFIDFSAGVDGGWLVAVDLTTLERTRLFDLYGTQANTSLHISGKGYNKPGWVVVSTYDCKVDHAWSCDKIMAVELDGDHRVLNLAHAYNCGDDYWTETHAVVNRDFTRIYFNSDGGSCGIDAEVYQLKVPPFD